MNHFETFTHLAFRYAIDHANILQQRSGVYSTNDQQVNMQELSSIAKQDIRTGIKVAAIIQNQKNKLQ